MIGSVVIYRSVDGGTDWTINDQTSLKAKWTGTGYYISVDSADGLFGTDISEEVHTLPQTIGDKAGLNLHKGRGITLSGTIYGSAYVQLFVAAEYMEQMFWNSSVARKLIYKPLNWTEQIYVKARVNNDLSITHSKPQSDGEYRWSWTVGLRADNPRKYKLSDDTLAYAWMV